MGSRSGEFRRKAALGLYELTGHAKDEMEQDGFAIRDVKSAICNAKMLYSQRRGGGRRKYILSGSAESGRRMRLVVRLTESGKLRVITVFAE